MNTEEQGKQNEFRDVVEVADEVVQIVSGLAANKTEGVAAMSGGVTGGIAERLGRKNLSKGVKVDIDEEEVTIDVYIVAKYGEVLTEVFKNVQQNVKEAVEHMTGLNVEKVNVHTQGLAFEEEEDNAEENEYEIEEIEH